MKNKLFIFILFFNSTVINAQHQNSEDSLKAIINQQKGDTTEVNALAYLGNRQKQFISAFKYARQGLLLAQKINYKRGEADCFIIIAIHSVDFSMAIQNALSALNIYQELHDNAGIAQAHLMLQGPYWNAGDYKNGLAHAFIGEKIAEINNVNIVPQDIGRVLLNLYNNAFYAVNEKKNQQTSGYGPTVSVSTKKLDDKVTLTVKDNGNGIPQNIADKIFQPFFTTKPTGEGTGLGLSLTYDVIKAHGGEIKVATKENEGSEFIIEIPVI